MSLTTYLNPDVIKDGSISASNIDGTVASKSYVDDTITSAISTKANVDDVYTKSEVDDIASRNKGLITELATAGDGYNVKLDWSLDPTKNGTIDPAYRGQVNLGANCTTSNTFAYSEGSDNIASGSRSHAEGARNVASYNASHAEGFTNTSSGYASHAEGAYNVASGESSHAEGMKGVSSGSGSHAEGAHNISSGLGSHVEGGGNVASNHTAHAGGAHTVASGTSSSTAIGTWVSTLNLTGDAGATVYTCNNLSNIIADNPDYLSYAIGPHNYGYISAINNQFITPVKIKSVDTSASTIEVESTLSAKAALNGAECVLGTTIAYGNYSFAARGISVGGSAWTVNRGGFAKGDCSFVGGNCNSAYNNSEVAFGHFNKSTQSSDASRAPIATIGIGDDKEHRKNAIEIMQNGDAYMFGVGGYDGSN